MWTRKPFPGLLRKKRLYPALHLWAWWHSSEACRKGSLTRDPPWGPLTPKKQGQASAAVTWRSRPRSSARGQEMGVFVGVTNGEGPSGIQTKDARQPAMYQTVPLNKELTRMTYRGPVGHWCRWKNYLVFWAENLTPFYIQFKVIIALLY